MKSPIATMALAASLALAAPARAQVPGAGSNYPPSVRNRPAPLPGGRPALPPAGGSARPAAPRTTNPAPAPGSLPAPPTAAPAPARRDDGVKPAADQPPEPLALEEIGAPTIPLPDVPLDPYLLRKENGPFMVVVHTFRGPQATKYALALTLELRDQFKIPAYVFHLKIQPGGSNIRNVQPTAPPHVANADISAPEKYRVYDEAAVLVGDCPTIDDAEKLLHRVKKLKPSTLDGLPTIWGHRKGQGLKWAMVTQNPLIPAQALYPGGRLPGHGPAGGPIPAKPGDTFDPFVAASAFQQIKKPDPLVERMNRGPNSVYKCPGPYTLPVAEFNGRSSDNAADPKFNNESFLRKSPLATAADDAERLAANLTRCKTLDPQIRPYVYHDRFSSKVCLGAFSGPDDPRLARLRQQIPTIIGEMLSKRYTELPLAPSAELMAVPRP